MLDNRLFGSTQLGRVAGNARLLATLSCLLAALLLALALSAALYNRAHASRLLASIPLQAAPSLLVTTNRAGGRGANGDDLSPSYGTSSSLSQDIVAGSNDIVGSLLYQQAANSNLGGAANSGACSLDSDPWRSQTAAANFYQQNNTNNKQAKSRPANQINPAAKLRNKSLRIPCHLLFQLIGLEFLILFMLLSQNWFRHSSAWYQQQQGAWRTPAGAAWWAPVGQANWCLVLLLCYLVSAISCWLLTQFLRLLVSCSPAPRAHSPHHLKSDGACYLGAGAPSSGACALQRQGLVGPSRDSNSADVSSSHGNATNSSSGTSNGRAADHNQELGASKLSQTTTATITSQYDNNGNILAASRLLHNNNNEPRQPCYQRRLDRLVSDSSEATTAHYWPVGAARHSAAAGACLPGADRAACCLLHYQFYLTHLLPLLLVALFYWLSNSQWQLIQLNELTFVSSFASQLACWPLILEAGAANFSLLLYLIPGVSVHSLFDLHCDDMTKSKTQSLTREQINTISQNKQLCCLLLCLAAWCSIQSAAASRKQAGSRNSSGAGQRKPAANPYGQTNSQLNGSVDNNNSNPFVLSVGTIINQSKPAAAGSSMDSPSEAMLMELKWQSQAVGGVAPGDKQLKVAPVPK